MSVLPNIRNQALPDQCAFVKREAKRLGKLLGKSQDKKHKFYLNLVSRQLGYLGYDDLYRRCSDERDRWIEELKAKKIVCASRMPDSALNYYFVTMHENFQYSYYSHWTGYDDQGRELRAPSLIKPEYFIKYVREYLLQPLCVIYTPGEFFNWMFSWRGHALVSREIAEGQLANFSRPRSSNNPPYLSAAKK